MNKYKIPNGKKVMDVIKNTNTEHFPFIDITSNKENPKMLRMIFLPKLNLVKKHVYHMYVKWRLKRSIYSKK